MLYYTQAQNQRATAVHDTVQGATVIAGVARILCMCTFVKASVPA
jgi:hypothetical protein